MHQRNRQAGVSMIGGLFIAIVVIAGALMAVRTIPSYIEYYTIQKAVHGALEDVPDGSAAAVQRAFDKRIGADYVDSVDWRDLRVIKQGNDIVGNISWEKRLPLFYNISLLLEFEVNVTK